MATFPVDLQGDSRYLPVYSNVLPAAGQRQTTGNFNSHGLVGAYWSSTLYSAEWGYYMLFNSNVVQPDNYLAHSIGMPVRCVLPPPPAPTIDVDPATATFAAAGGTKSDFVVTTTDFTGTPTVVAIDNATSETAAWITDASLSGAATPFTLSVTAAANSATTPRSATITLTAGTATATVTVTQRGTLWGGENHVLYFGTENRLSIGRWDTSLTTEDEALGVVRLTEADRSKLVFTQFGSVIGFDLSGTVSGSMTAIRFNPMSTTPSGYTAINNYGKPTTAWVSTVENSPSVSSDAYHNEAHLAEGRGDICKLAGLTSAQALEMLNAGTLDDYDSGWRLPTNEENRMFIGIAANNTQSSFDTSSGYYSWSGIFPANTAREEDPRLPAAGYRNRSNGSVYGQGSFGYYWSSTAYSSSYGHHLYFNSSSVHPSSYDNYYATGFSVRCVRDE
jgi:uncharacterized protein (TIGR02145 family)